MTLGLDEGRNPDERKVGLLLHLGNLPEASKRGFDLRMTDRILQIAIHKQFDVLPMASAWAKRLIDAAPGPFRAIEIDVSNFVTLSSTISAGLVQLSDFYRGRNEEGLRVIGASKRTKSVIKMMKLEDFFEYQDTFTPVSAA